MSANPEKHHITPQMLSFILQSFRNKGYSQSELADLIEKSEAWVSKLLNGKQQSIDDSTFRKMEISLEIDFFGVSKNGKNSPLAEKIAAMVDSDPLFASIALAAKDAIAGARATFTPRYVPTEEMADLGKKIIKIATENPEKPGKVAKLVLQLLA